MDAVEFWSICSVNGLVLSPEQVETCGRYVEELLYWNERVNMISRRDTDHIWLRHILHSITPVLMNVLPTSGKLLDIGTGGGLPGIPIKIVSPKLDVTLLDSIAKKVNTVSMLASHVTPHALRAIRNRAEELPKERKQAKSYDVVVSRATAPLVDLMTWSKPLLKDGGRIVALKGGALTNEVDHAQGKHPNSTITIQDINILGVEWFLQENKRIVIAEFGKGSEAE